MDYEILGTMEFLGYIFIVFCIIGLVFFAAVLVQQWQILSVKREGSNLMKHNTYEQEWHKATDVPCPGAFIVCEDSKHQLYFGYAVADNGRAALWHLPDYLLDFRKPPATIAPQTLRRIPIMLFVRWQYVEKRILPTETLGTYEEQYKRP